MLERQTNSHSHLQSRPVLMVQGRKMVHTACMLPGEFTRQRDTLSCLALASNSAFLMASCTFSSFSFRKASNCKASSSSICSDFFRASSRCMHSIYETKCGKAYQCTMPSFHKLGGQRRALIGTLQRSTTAAQIPCAYVLHFWTNHRDPSQEEAAHDTCGSRAVQ